MMLSVSHNCLIYGYMISYICFNFKITSSNGSIFMHHPTDSMVCTTSFVIPVVEHWLKWEVAQWDQSGDLLQHEQMSY